MAKKPMGERVDKVEALEKIAQPAKPANFSAERAKRALDKIVKRFVKLQDGSGYWVFDLEADVTIPSEYIMFKRFLGHGIEPEVQERLRSYILAKQLPDGGWPLYDVDGNADISASVKAYLALKILGDDAKEEHMVRARIRIQSMGGAERVNVFTRITLAIFGQVSWEHPPAMPIEILLLPEWFFFHLSKVSYWSRTVVTPLLILYHLRPVCQLKPSECVHELFRNKPERMGHMDHFFTGPGVPGKALKNSFILLDRILKKTLWMVPAKIKEKALRKAEKWTLDHMRGVGGIGAIFPAMANAVMALDRLGYSDDNPDFARGYQAVDDLVVDNFASKSSVHANDTTTIVSSGESALPKLNRGQAAGLAQETPEAMVQPCVSPVWDTCLTLSALMEADMPHTHSTAKNAVKWLFEKQVFIKGDWKFKAPDLDGGGWAFQFENDYYPDLDDTSMVVMALARAGALKDPDNHERIRKAVNWILGMQCSDGGWAAFDIDNNASYLNHIPFADHGALLDPSTEDLTARCIEMLGVLGFPREHQAVDRAIDYLKRVQMPDGSWFGRWGVNYIYGTWSVLCGLRQAGENMDQPYVRQAVEWLKSKQNPDGGWGESCDSYYDKSLAGMGISTASQTSWSLLGLLAAGEVKSRAVQKGVRYLLDTQEKNGSWEERLFTGTGFPRVFYLRYHGYSQYFPMWALGVYSRLEREEPTAQHANRVTDCALLGF